jgi:hypothetical protein
MPMSRTPAEREGLGAQSCASLWALSFGIATVLGWSTVLFVYFGMWSVGKPLTFRTSVLAGLPDWYFWAALTPLVFWLGQRYRFDREGWPFATLVHVIAAAVVSVVELGLFTTFNHWFYYNPWAPAPADFWEAYYRNVLRYFHFAFIVYWLIVVAAHAFRLYRQARQRQVEALRLAQENAELQARLSQAQLEVLRAQLHPHFLFNTLNTISGLIRDRRGDQAVDVVSRLGQLLRRSLGRSDHQQPVPLSEELDFTEAYLAIEQARFRDRLEVEYQIEPEALGAAVPSMLLQPLVENAIRHGLADSAQGRVSIRAACKAGNLYLDVLDNGRGLKGPGNPGAGAGIGLANTRALLEWLYGPDHRFDLSTGNGSGVQVSIRIPHRTAGRA